MSTLPSGRLPKPNRNRNRKRKQRSTKNSQTLGLRAPRRARSKKDRAAPARSRLASARAATTAELAARDADRRRRASASARTRRLARSPLGRPDDSRREGLVRATRCPPAAWASSAREVRGNYIVLDRFMGSLTDMRASSPPRSARRPARRADVGVDRSVRGRGPAGRRVSVSETPAPRAPRTRRGARGARRRRRARTRRGRRRRPRRPTAPAPERRANGAGAHARDPAWRRCRCRSWATRASGETSDARRGRRGAAAGLRARDAAVATPRDLSGRPAGGSNPTAPSRGGPPVPRLAFKTCTRRAAARTRRDQGGRRVRTCARSAAPAGDANAGSRVRVRGDAPRGRGEGVEGERDRRRLLSLGHVKKRRKKTLWEPEEKSASACQVQRSRAQTKKATTGVVPVKISTTITWRARARPLFSADFTS